MAKANGIIGSLLWKSGERIMVQGIGLLVQIILARLLMPEDFASLAIITAIVNYLGIFVQCGLSAAVVQKKDLSEIDVSTLTTLSLLVALILYVGLFLMAPVINSWYNMEELVWPIRVMGIALFLYSFNSIQSGLLQRKMMFQTMFVRSLLATPISAAIGITMAYLGCGVWALICYVLSNILAIVIFMNMLPEIRLRLGFSKQSAKALYSFSLKILGTNLVSAGGDTIRTMTIGKVYKPATLAYYDRAYTYSGLVTQVVNTSISSVLLPVFSRSQDDKSHIKEMARRSVSMSAFVMIPVLLLVALVSKPLILIVLTDKWLPCAPFLSLFCLLRIPGIITSVDKQVYLSLWKSQIGLYYEMILLAINLLSLVLMIPYGVFAIAIGYVVVEFAGNFMLCVISDKVYNYSLIERTKDLIKPVFSSIIMLACGYLLSLIELPLWMTLICQILVCSVIYLFMQYILRDSSLAFIINKFRKK